jgi:hypothetical protein
MMTSEDVHLHRLRSPMAKVIVFLMSGLKSTDRISDIPARKTPDMETDDRRSARSKLKMLLHVCLSDMHILQVARQSVIFISSYSAYAPPWPNRLILSSLPFS